MDDVIHYENLRPAGYVYAIPLIRVNRIIYDVVGPAFVILERDSVTAVAVYQIAGDDRPGIPFEERNPPVAVVTSIAEDAVALYVYALI